MLLRQTDNVEARSPLCRRRPQSDEPFQKNGRSCSRLVPKYALVLLLSALDLALSPPPFIRLSLYADPRPPASDLLRRRVTRNRAARKQKVEGEPQNICDDAT